MSSFFRRLFGTSSNISMADASQKVQQLIAENNLSTYLQPLVVRSEMRHRPAQEEGLVLTTA